MSLPLAGRQALITGASRGIGAAIASAYLHAGASLFLCARDEAALAETGERLRREAAVDQRVEWQAADVAQPAACDRLVAKALTTLGWLDILVNNAGVYGPKGRIEEVDWQEWVAAIQINLLGSVYLVRALLPHFRSRRYGKIVQLSGGGATSPLPHLSAYAASKAAIVRFVETIAGETRDDRIDINALAPGAINTRMLDELLAAGPEKIGAEQYARALRQREEGGAPVEQAAALAVYLASPASDGLSGKLISAVWDPWRDLDAHRDDLMSSDIYTLRRIVPRDRGREWG
ncbi:MAG: SDR family oxidoreductase [Chloroflexi bacterium]|nr:SDR family oxidoreductase [Chloroflexota bacterium]